MQSVGGDQNKKRNARIFEEHDDVEISIDEIETGLFLGNATAARTLEVLRERKIVYILTLDIVPLPENVTQKSYLTTKFVKISDMPKEDLLHVIEPCIKFITEALESGKNVLVHCYFGVSRSAAIVIAYIMRKYQTTYTCAFERVKSKRRFIGPNTGFVQQLKLYRKMNYQIKPQNPYYKSYRLRLASNQVRKAKILPQNCMDVIKPDPGLTQENPEPIVYRCRKCRRVVASKSNVLLHKITTTATITNDKSDSPKLNATTENEMKTLNTTAPTTMVEQIAQQIHDCTITEIKTAGTGIVVEEPPVYCDKMIFVEPLAWMKDILTQTNGKLNCPKCSNKIGHFNWVGSSICPCGDQVCPAFYLVPSKVELSKVVQNVQMTV